MKRRDPIRLSVALLFLAGAILLFGCKGKKSAKEEDVQNMMTQQSENLRLVCSQNGNLSYRFETPLLERYELAREPFMETSAKGSKSRRITIPHTSSNRR